MKNSRLAGWQITLIFIATALMLGPFIWDVFSETFTAVQDIELDELFTRDAAFGIGFILLLIVGAYEIYEDFKSKPKSKHIK